MSRGHHSKHLALIALLLGGLSLASGLARADNLPVGGGCYAVGNGPTAYPEISECTYTAQTNAQTMYIGTPSYWRAYVERPVLGYSDYCYDESTGTFYAGYCYTNQQIVLADGYGNLLDGSGAPRVPGLIQIHPVPGEAVNLELHQECYPGLPTTCGKDGVIGAYE